MQNILLPYTKELQRLENCLEGSQDSGAYLNPLQEQMQRAKQNVLRLESIHENKKKLQADYGAKLQKLNDKLSQSMEQSLKKKEIQLLALSNKLKKKNVRRKPRKMSAQEEIREIKEEITTKVELVEQVPQKIQQKKEVTIKETPTIKLAEPKHLDEFEFFKKLNKSMDAASQRKSQRLDNIKQRLHGQDEIIHKHLEKSNKTKEEQEQNRLTQIYNKLLNLTQKEQQKKSKNKIKQKKKSLQINMSSSESNKYTNTNRYEEQRSEPNRTVRSITQDIKFINVKQRLEKLQNEREQQVKTILDKHQQYSYRLQQNKLILDELSNTCQYYNFKIKEQYLL
ncbi:unnamed protein product [Paramecium pentaurelia]|uniref:Uncharacterized protein n=1 Tax=Paramecium pentaurelia TaxID=43138 RepID=A0A8S1V0D2_9CILI|nr:unnamed protein product [Paramecium pentaurelia]